MTDPSSRHVPEVQPGAVPAPAATAAAPIGVTAAATRRAGRHEVWCRFRRNRLAMAGLVFLVLLVLAAVLAPWITPVGVTERSSHFRSPPSRAHWFGTDLIGRDVFSRVVYGARVSLTIGVAATAMSVAIGVLLGAVAGFVGGIVDTLIMRVTDVFLAIPYVLLAVAIATVLGRSQSSVILVLGLTGWLAVCRIVRASFLSLREQEFVEAARALGFTRSRIMFRHMLPNAMQPVVVYGTIAIGTAVLAEAALSFLGVGPQEPTPAWGLMVWQGKGDLANAPHLLFFPATALAMTVVAFVFVGDGLRDALDPTLT